MIEFVDKYIAPIVAMFFVSLFLWSITYFTGLNYEIILAVLILSTLFTTLNTLYFEYLFLPLFSLCIVFFLTYQLMENIV